MELQKTNNLPAFKLPSFEDLVLDPDKAFKDDKLNALLNNEPPKAWLKPHPVAKHKDGTPFYYLPIEKVEYLLTKTFGAWYVEVIDYKQVFNAVTCHVRLHLTHPFTGEKILMDGVGAQQVQVKSGSSPADLQNINNGAVQMALPAAKSYAIKDAADHLGKLFGRDVNRAETIGSDKYQAQAERWATVEEKRMVQKIASCKTIGEIVELQKNNPDYPIEMFEERKEELRNETKF